MTEARGFNPEKIGSKESRIEHLKRMLAENHAIVDDHNDGIATTSEGELENAEMQIAKIQKQLQELEK